MCIRDRVIGVHEVCEVYPQLLVAVVVEAFDGRFLDGAVHPLHLSVGPRVVRLGEPVLDIVGLADHVEAHLARPSGVSVARLLGELDAVVGEDRVDAIGHGFQQVFEELPRRCLLYTSILHGCFATCAPRWPARCCTKIR